IQATEAGATSFTFSLSTGSLPDGLTLDPNGTLSGTPTALGLFSFTVLARDGSGFTASQAYTLRVQATPAASVNPANLTPATPLPTNQPSGTATVIVGGNPVPVDGPFSYGRLAGFVLSVSQSVAVTFTPRDSTDYTTVSTRVTVNVTSVNVTSVPP